jgi:hypothetical protein
LIYLSQIGILPTFVSGSKISRTTICYYALLEIKDVPVAHEPTSEEHSPKSETEEASKLKPSTKTQEYIVCLICEIENDEGFALYPTAIVS